MACSYSRSASSGKRWLAACQHVVGLAPVLDVAQHLRFGQQLGAGVRRRCARARCASARAPAAPGPGAPAASARRVCTSSARCGLSIARQPGFGGGEVAALLGGLRQQQPGLRQALVGARLSSSSSSSASLAPARGAPAAPAPAARSAAATASASCGCCSSSCSAPSVSQGAASSGCFARDALQLRDRIGVALQRRSACRT